MNILAKKRTTGGFLEKLSTVPKRISTNVQATIKNFIKFAKEKHQSIPEQICDELIKALQFLIKEGIIRI